MPHRDAPAQSTRTQSGPAPYPAEKARAGRIVLNTPTRRGIFIAGLAGAIVLALLLGLLAAL
jgi:hypothetical protein